MTMFRRKADRYIDDAHNAICDAEAMLMHAYTEETKARAYEALNEAQAYLRRAVEAKRAWDAVEHDDYEAYPVVPRTTQKTLF